MPCGCVLLQGPFALSVNGVLHKILNTWGSRLTWTAKREHASQIVGAMDAFFAGAHFLSVQNPGGIGVNGLGSARGWDGGYISWVNLRFPKVNHGFSFFFTLIFMS